MAAGKPPDPNPDLPAAATKHMDVPQKIMFYGDSITMGSAGRWTWRYRLWQGLQAAGTAVHFVGPETTVWTYSGLFTHEYRDPNFDTAHAAMAGMKFTDPLWTVSQLAGQYHPDVIVGLIGFNDLLHGVTTAQLVDNWRSQIASAREADPGVDIVLVEMGQTWYPHISEYNAGLSALAAEMDRQDSRVVATTPPTMDMWTDTQDGVHLTSSGELLYAHAVAPTLAALGLASGTPAADPAIDHSFAPVPTTTIVGNELTISWPAVDYATSEDIYARDDTTGASGEARFSPGTSLSTPVQPGHTYEISLAPVQWWAEIGTRSPTVSFTAPSI